MSSVLSSSLLSLPSIVTPSLVAIVSAFSDTPFGVSSLSFEPPHDQAFPIYVPADGNACAAIDEDLAGKVVIAMRGACAFTTKAENVLNAGGSILVVYNNVAGTLTPDFGTEPIVGGAFTMADGQKIVQAYEADPSITIKFPSTYYNLANTLTPGLVSDFTSYGLTLDQYFKPCECLMRLLGGRLSRSQRRQDRRLMLTYILPTARHR